MKKRNFDHNKLPSRHVRVGSQKAPHRSYYYAMGLDEDDIDKPFVGVATCWNESAPCNISLMRQSKSVKDGVSKEGGTPREFTTITVTDGTFSLSIAIIMPGKDLSQPATPTKAS